MEVTTIQAYATLETGLPLKLRLVHNSPPAPAAPTTGHGSDVLNELLGQLAELVADRVATRLAAPPRESTDEWLATRRAAEHLGISRDSFGRLAAEGSIPTEQGGVGRKLYIRRSDLDNWRCSGSAPMVAMRSRRHG
jgi:excisionase family DNA binding protein